MACDCAVCRSPDPRDQRLRSSVVVQVGGRNILIDAGPDLRQQVLRSGIRTVGGVLLTHEHMDHIAGIDELRAFNFAQKRPMDLYGNTATVQAVRRMFHYAFAEERYPGTPELLLHDVGPGAFDVADVPMLPVEVMHHTMPVFAYRIADFAYITDAKTILPAERDKLRGLDVLVVNALRRKPHHSHFNLEEALELVRDLSPKRAYFTHISHLLGTHSEVSSELPPGVELAYDGLAIETRAPVLTADPVRT